MKNKYFIKSDRYNHTHSFQKILNSDYYCFKPEEEWMPLYITYNEDGKTINFIDTEGGPCINEGWCNNEIIVEKIEIVNNALMFKLNKK